MNALFDFCASLLTRMRSSTDAVEGPASGGRPDALARDRSEIAMSGMSYEDARWYYERLRWRS